MVEANLGFLLEIVEKYVDIVFANEEEARAFTSQEPEAALDLAVGICDIAVVKVGKDGSFIKSGDEKVLVKPRLSNCIDTTGAGEFFMLPVSVRIGQQLSARSLRENWFARIRKCRSVGR